MAEQFKVSVPDLRQVAQQLQGLSQGFNAAWTSFSGQVDAMGDIFGDDDVGGLIGMSYQAAHALADETFTSAVTALADFADGLGQMAGSYETTEQTNMTSMTSLGG